MVLDLLEGEGEGELVGNPAVYILLKEGEQREVKPGPFTVLTLHHNHGTVLVVYFNTLKTTFDFPQHGYDTHKHGNKEKLSINSFSLFACKFVICKKLI